MTTKTTYIALVCRFVCKRFTFFLSFSLCFSISWVFFLLFICWHTLWIHDRSFNYSAQELHWNTRNEAMCSAQVANHFHIYANSNRKKCNSFLCIHKLYVIQWTQWNRIHSVHIYSIHLWVVFFFLISSLLDFACHSFSIRLSHRLCRFCMETNSVCAAFAPGSVTIFTKLYGDVRPWFIAALFFSFEKKAFFYFILYSKKGDIKSRIYDCLTVYFNSFIWNQYTIRRFFMALMIKLRQL